MVETTSKTQDGDDASRGETVVDGRFPPGGEPAADDGTESAGAQEANTSKNKRGIYLLPNLLTTGTLFGGFYAILAGLEGHYEAAAIAIFAAMFFDGLDGRVARLTNTQSEFGMEYDLSLIHI